MQHLAPPSQTLQLSQELTGAFRGSIIHRVLPINKPQDTQILIGDITDQASIDAVARRAKVILAMAGPYAKMGEPLVAACVKEGTHYVDTTGEGAWNSCC